MGRNLSGGFLFLTRSPRPLLKQSSNAVAVILTFVIFVPYIRSIWNGTIRPHVFTWIIWGVGTLVVYFAQLAGDAGIGAISVGISGLLSCYTAFLAYQKRGDTKATRLDWIFLIVALSALPLWMVTSDPLWAVILLTLSDTIGFGPTLRKALVHPEEESLLFYGLTGVRSIFIIIALEAYNWTTILFPAVLGAACLLTVLLLFVLQRKQSQHRSSRP